MMRRSVLLLVALLAACSGGSEPETVPRSPAGTTSARCENSLPFAPGSVPAGIKRTPAPGVGGGGESPVGTSAFHFSSNTPGRFIDVFRSQGRYALSASTEVTVLGGSGRIGEIHEGFGAAFELASEPAGCRPFSVEAFGVTRDELRQFVEGLQRAA